ncbi:MAG TPA: DUF4296 domain-containing protein [Candidatus Kryptonia bacterium]
MAKRRLSLVLASALLIVSCAPRSPIPHAKFVELYVRLQLIDARYGKDPLIQKAMADSLLKAFNVDQKLIDSTIAWYGRDPERLRSFFDDAQKKMEELRSFSPKQQNR